MKRALTSFHSKGHEGTGAPGYSWGLAAAPMLSSSFMGPCTEPPAPSCVLLAAVLADRASPWLVPAAQHGSVLS